MQSMIYSPFDIAIIILIIALLAFLCALPAILSKKHTKAEAYGLVSNAIMDTYSSLALIDLSQNLVIPINPGEIDEQVFKGQRTIVPSKERVLAARLAAKPFRESLAQFISMDTIRERIGGLSNISYEYVDNDGKWTRLHFIVAEKDSNGVPQQIIWATEPIDEDKKRQEQFKALAETDSLTHTLNRSGGENVISELLLDGKKGMLLVIDADHFKYVNETYGHDKGDEVIITLANVLKDTFRETDVLFRLGGDAFVVFVEGVDSEDLGCIAINRLFNNVDKVSFEGINDWKIRLSIGAVLFGENDKDAFSVLYHTADKAMNESKKHEGNYITFANS